MGCSISGKLYCALVGILLISFKTGTTQNTGSAGFVYINTTNTDLHSENGRMPDLLDITVESGENGAKEELKLKKSAVDINAPLFVICADGKSICREKLDDVKDFALYQDTQNRAAVSIAKEPSAQGGKTVKVEGSLLVNDVQYSIEDMGGNPTENSNNTQYRLHRVLVEDAGLSDFKVLDQPMEYQQNEGRYRRQGSVRNYGVEILPVIDYKIYQKWFQRSTVANPDLRAVDTKNNIRKYFAHVVNGMDLRYRGIPANDFKIYIKLAGYVIADRPESSPWTTPIGGERTVNADTALDQFFAWKRDIGGLPAHDHATLFTGLDLYTLNSRQERMMSVTGYAYLGRICNDLSVSIVEDRGGFGCVKTATHELGHSLGAKHDGDQNVCLTEDQFIMAGSSVPTTDINKLNPWKFSDCSVRSFREKLASLDRLSFRGNCLSNVAQTSNPREWDAHLSRHPGQLFGVDNICAQVLGPTSYMCRDLLPSSAEVCTSLWCHINGTNQCRQYVPPRGTTCGSQKWCIDGVCKVDARSPVIKDDCVFGDQPGIAYQGETCAQIVSTKPRYCYESFIRQRCCESCSKVYTGVRGCEYGNRQSRCEQWWCSLNNPDTPVIRKQCCGTCQIGQRFTTTPASTLRPLIPTKPTGEQPGKTTPRPTAGCKDYNNNCGLAITSQGRQQCYQQEFYAECCLSCQREIQDVSGCEYGDRNPSACTRIGPNNAQRACNDPDIGSRCCRTCGSFQVRESQTSSSAISSHVTMNQSVILLVIAILYLSR